MKSISAIFKSRCLSISIIILISIYSSELYSQVLLRPTFKKIEYLTYDLNSPRTKIKDQIIVEAYIKIDENGKMYIIERNKELKYYSYQLSNAEIGILNQVFNGEKKLQKLIKNQKEDADVFYAGYYKFLKYVDLNNHPDQITFIESDRLDHLEEVLSILFSKSNSYDNHEIIEEPEFEIDNLFIDEAYKNHMKKKRLPNIALPPPPMN